MSDDVHTVTFTTAEERVYVVTDGALTFDHEAVRIIRIDLFSEDGDLLDCYSPEDDVVREDLELITTAAAVAGLSVIGLQEYTP